MTEYQRIRCEYTAGRDRVEACRRVLRGMESRGMEGSFWTVRLNEAQQDLERLASALVEADRRWGVSAAG